MRIPAWLWFAPGAAYVVFVTVGSVLVDRSSLPLSAVAGAIAVVALACALLALGERTGRSTGLVVPGLVLASAAFVHGADGGAIGSSLLLTGLPAGWMAFEHGTKGAVTAVAGIGAVTAVPYVLGATDGVAPMQQWDDVIALSGLVSMVLLTWLAGRILHVAQADLVARTRSLEREAATNRAVFDSVDAALAVFLPDDHVLVNARAAGLGHGLHVLRVTAPQRATASAYDVVDADGVTATPPETQALLRAQRGEEFSNLVQWTGSPDVRRAMVCSSRRILLDDCPDGATGTVFVAWDATDALDSARVRDEFLGTLTHELRTPLTAIVGYLELHAELAPQPTPEAARCLDGVGRNVRALADHIEDLLVSARPEALATAVVDVAEVAGAAVTASAERARAADLALTLDCPVEVRAVANAAALRQVLDHLLDNALTYTESGSVTVEVVPGAEPCGGFTLTVTDTGTGMTEHECRRVFDRFYRTESAVRRVLPGLGMGLAVTRQLVAAHGGTITARSTPGVGSTFEVTIPGPRPTSVS